MLFILVFSKNLISMNLCPTLEEDWNNCYGKFIIEDKGEYEGDTLIGQFDNNYLNGYGAYYWTDDNFYLGQYRNGERHGFGYYQSGDGKEEDFAYIGQFKNDSFSGVGVTLVDLWNPAIYKNGERIKDIETCPDDEYAVWDKCFGFYTSENPDDKIKTMQGYFEKNTIIFGLIEYSGEHKEHRFVGIFDNGFPHIGFYKTPKISIDDMLVGVFIDGKFAISLNKKDEPKILNYENTIDTKDDITNEIINANSGSGFAISYDGYVITNHHVINGCQNVFIHDRGLKIPATIVEFDIENDIALLKANFKPKYALPLSNNEMNLLQDVYAAGFPFGRTVSSSVKVTKGIISSLSGIGNNFSRFQIDASIQKGSSGGPIINNRGNVIGVTVEKLSFKEIIEKTGDIPENVNFGIKSNIVKNILSSININLQSPNKNDISKNELGTNITNSTYYLSCWMTWAQLERLRSQKVMFEDLVK